MKIVLRIILSPIAFLIGVFILFAGTVIPILLTTSMLSLFYLIVYPIISLFKFSGVDVGEFEPLFDFTSSNMKNHFITATVYVWLPFVVVYFYITKGEIIILNEK